MHSFRFILLDFSIVSRYEELDTSENTGQILFTFKQKKAGQICKYPYQTLGLAFWQLKLGNKDV